MSISGYARVGVHSRKKETKHRVEKRSLVDEADYRFFPSFGGGRDPWRRGSDIERSFFFPFPSSHLAPVTRKEKTDVENRLHRGKWCCDRVTMSA